MKFWSFVILTKKQVQKLKEDPKPTLQKFLKKIIWNEEHTATATEHLSNFVSVCANKHSISFQSQLWTDLVVC